MHILSPLGRLAAVAAFTLLSACATGADFASSPSISAPNPALGAFLAARYAESVGDSSKAAQFYMQALQADPQNPELLEDGFMAGLMAGSPAATQLAPRLPNDALAALLRGNNAAMDGDYVAATNFYKTLPDDELTSLIQPVLLAWAAFGQGDEQEALSRLQLSSGNSAFASIYVLNAALIADAAGDAKQAAQLYGLLQGVPPTLRVSQILASWYARQGDPSRANAILTTLILTHPDLATALPQLRAQMYQPVVSTPEQGLAEAYLTVAASLSQPQALFLRTVFLRFALALQPNLSSARLILANSLLNSVPTNIKPSPALIETALAILEPVQPQDPLYATIVVQRASLDAMVGKTDKAIAELTTLLAAHPANPSLLAVAGDIRRNAGQCNLALPYYRRAITLVGFPPPASAWPLLFDRGICEDEAGNWAVAEPDIQLALKLAPNQPYVLNYLAYRWAQQGKNLQQAQQMLMQAVSLVPNDGALLDSLGFVELKLGNTQQALTLLIQAVQLAPGNAEVNAHLGDAFNQAGQHLQAVYQWDRALTLEPDAALKATLMQQIQQAIGTMAP